MQAGHVALFAAGLLVLGITGFAVLRSSESSATRVVQAPLEPAPIQPPDTITPEPEPLRPRETLTPPSKEAFESLATTVVWPLEVELELVRAANAPKADDAPAYGAGATAKLKGSIRGGEGQGVRAKLTFAAGANEGRVLYCDALGNFGASDLQPGLSIVHVLASGTPGAVREVLLRQGREQLVHISFGRPSFVAGEVFDAGGKPLADAKVTMDGQTTQTDPLGLFEFRAMTPGEVIVTVEKAGFTRYREKLTVPAASRVEKGRIQYALEAGARLTLSIEESINARQEALVFLLPESGGGQRKFPWSDVNPVRMWPGGTTTIEDLPRGVVSVRVFHAGARGNPMKSTVTLAPGENATQSLHLEPAPMLAGRILDGGGPASNASVRLEAPDRGAAMLSVFGESNYLHLESEVFPSLPPAMQEVTTNARGEFQLTSYEDVAPIRYLTATSRDGQRVASRVVRLGEERVELVLEPLAGGAGELTLSLSDRFQPLPVKVIVNGEPRDPFSLPPGRDLHVEGLVEGSWLVSVRWSTNTVHSKAPVELRPSATIDSPLPEGAIQGQDEETRRRAGLR